ncbi:amidohydrolase family protein [Leptospira wolffii]|uniref:amidohydrolase family protein n=1 Tax=Leptospira wolffii TaxID=409998 RepID=UPI0002FCC3F7|nr:amidohydrolase family protein [Leptospira wolffii]EPG67349.1 amidohydrolase family protein [Leptospira wolffii serovar Khorat str. Khorat-H2]
MNPNKAAGWTSCIIALAILSQFAGCKGAPAVLKNEPFAIKNARIFDGERIIEDTTVVIQGKIIQSVGGPIPADAVVIDAHGATLMPGLIDSHVHTDEEGLKDALKFGITTELEMMGSWSKRERKKIAERHDLADVRSPGMGVTAKGGHPSEYIHSSSNLIIRYFFSFPSVSTPEEAVKFVDEQISEGADYIKIIIEDGTIVGYPNLPEPSDAVLISSVNEAHRQGKMAVAHATTIVGTKRALKAGVDGFAHIFVDSPPPTDLIQALSSSKTFIIPTLSVISSAFGNNAAWLAKDERVRSKLSKEWLESLSGTMNTHPQGSLNLVFNNVKILHRAGVDILAGSDVSEPAPGLGGLAHGVSLHHELQLLVAAGLTPLEALRAATSVPARRFGLIDRGRIANGFRADLVLVDGDPSVRITDTLNTKAVWRGGVLFSPEQE